VCQRKILPPFQAGRTKLSRVKLCNIGKEGFETWLWGNQAEAFFTQGKNVGKMRTIKEQSVRLRQHV
jgi:hypothetical protein